jgi:hypothetical protein
MVMHTSGSWTASIGQDRRGRGADVEAVLDHPFDGGIDLLARSPPESRDHCPNRLVRHDRDLASCTAAMTRVVPDLKHP